MSSAYRVIQRVGSDPGNISVTGSCFGVGTVEARFNGGAWADLDTDVTSGLLSGTLASQAQGQGNLEVRFKNKPNTVHTTAYVGFGDVFVVAGQSNSVGQGTSNQTYSHATLKAGTFTKAGVWAEAADPIETVGGAARYGIQDSTGGGYGGSVWIKMLTDALAGAGRPIGLVPCGFNGSVIADWARNEADHDDTTTLYGAMVKQATDAGGVKAVLWWQGESDAIAATAKATYKTALQALGDKVFEDLGVPLIACRFLDCSGINAANQTAICDGISECWGANHILAGPDLHDIVSDDTAHATSNTNLATCASRWWTAIATALY